MVCCFSHEILKINQNIYYSNLEDFEIRLKSLNKNKIIDSSWKHYTSLKFGKIN